MWSLLSTATEATSVRSHPAGSFAQFSTTRYRCSPEPRMVDIWFSQVSDSCLARLAPDILRRDDALAKRHAHQLDVGSDAELGADLIAGVGRGLDTNMQRVGDLIHGFLRQQHAQDFKFPRAQRVDRRGFVGEP